MERVPWKSDAEAESACTLGPEIQTQAHVEITEAIREWDYGDYEGLTSPQIRELRAKQGLGSSWDIWRDGCPGGE